MYWGIAVNVKSKGNAVLNMEKKTKRCPYCGEEILAVAKKCKHCGEWLEPKEITKEKKACPICGEMVEEDSETCPYCHEPIRFADKTNNEVQNIKNNDYERANEHNKSSSTPKSELNPEKISPPKKSWLNNYGYIIKAILLFALIGGGYGVKQCVKEYKRKESLSRPNPFSDAFKKKRDDAFNILTKSPWQGNHTNSASEMEEGWLVTVNINIDTKLNYMSDEKYTEYGTFIMEISCSQEDMMWKAEGKIQYHEEGEFHLYSDTSLSEETGNISSEVIGANVIYNNTSVPDEDISMNVLRRLYIINDEMQKVGDHTMYKIKTLSNNSLVMGVMEENDVVKPSGQTLTFKR